MLFFSSPLSLSQTYVKHIIGSPKRFGKVRALHEMETNDKEDKKYIAEIVERI